MAIESTPLRILLVEDSIASAFIMEEQIHRRDPDMRVHIAKTLKEAFKDTRVFFPHIILLDLTLPDSDGDETIKQIDQLAKSVGGGHRCCIIAMSVEQSFRQPALAAGADDFMQKLIGENSITFMERINALTPRCSCVYS